MNTLYDDLEPHESINYTKLENLLKAQQWEEACLDSYLAQRIVTCNL